MPKGLLFPSPRASLFPQRHRDGVSRLTEGTPGGLVGKKKPLWRLVFFLGEGWGQGEKKHEWYLDSSWRASTLLSQAQIYFLGQQAARGVGGRGVDGLSANPYNK
jgi:hypothetical protein